jgi:hypothetical protein
VYVLARAKYLKVETVARERTIGDGSPFDPMARVFENKRLYLRDLAPLGRRAVNGKKFINCEIIGPGTAIIGMRSSETKPWPKMDNCHTDDVDCVQIAPTAQSRLAVSFLDCDFESCNFFQMTLLFYQRQNENLYWITPSADEPQLLLEGGKVDPSQ